MWISSTYAASMRTTFVGSNLTNEQIEEHIAIEDRRQKDTVFFNIIQSIQFDDVLDFQMAPNNGSTSYMSEVSRLVAFIFSSLKSVDDWTIFSDGWLMSFLKMSPMFVDQHDGVLDTLMLEGWLYNTRCIRYPFELLKNQYADASQAFLVNNDGTVKKLVVFHGDN